MIAGDHKAGYQPLMGGPEAAALRCQAGWLGEYPAGQECSPHGARRRISALSRVLRTCQVLWLSSCLVVQ
jgi:hypothetical protein